MISSKWYFFRDSVVNQIDSMFYVSEIKDFKMLEFLFYGYIFIRL